MMMMMMMMMMVMVMMMMVILVFTSSALAVYWLVAAAPGRYGDHLTMVGTLHLNIYAKTLLVRFPTCGRLIKVFFSSAPALVECSFCDLSWLVVGAWQG
ncbi:hypothetical protein B9Z19DRAFT_675256 [Tuber borchii]|uniref:Secreted protein n=1 Tax=Tuber borchii TaxID=42251 RepID=A0A2T6ZAD6_TUBBO|nr:hypothetical protein B9Z19DRAFT_675256 [Tuber borchii]